MHREESGSDGRGGRLAVVTGGASGIGLAVVDEFLAEGRPVVVLDREVCPREAARSLKVDVTDAKALTQAAGAMEGSVDAVICAAGIWDVDGDSGPGRLDVAVWRRTLDINLTGTMLTVNAFVDVLADDGAIVTVASVAGLAAMPRRDAYTASKGAVVALTRSWAIDLSRRGIRVNCVCPGPTRTPMIEALLEEMGERLIGLPQQRSAEPAEIARVIAFLASPGASYVSGAVIPVDGGATAALAGLAFPKRRSGT